jgi:hypothetical protein
MKEPKFKKDEWCFCEFKLQRIIKTDEDRITSVGDGFFETGSCDISDRCYPMEVEVKRISDEVAYWSKTFHELKNNGLNHPDLNRKLIEMWCEMCDNRNDETKLKELYENLSKFGNAIVRKVRDLNFEEIDGVRLFR